MGETTGVSWTDSTFNPWIGCARVHEGCRHCYAETLSNRTGKAVWGPAGTRVKTSPAYWQAPLKWNKAAGCLKTFDCSASTHADCCPQSSRHRVFCASMADVFEDWQGGMCSHKVIVDEPCPENGFQKSRFNAALWWRNDIGTCDAGQTTVNHVRGERLATMADVRGELFKLVDATPNLDWLMLTKRPDNIAKMWPRCENCRGDGFVTLSEDGGMLAPCGGCAYGTGRVFDGRGGSYRGNGKYRRNVWLLTSVSDQKTYDLFAHRLYHTANDLCPVLGLSAEPLLGPLKLWHDFDGDKVRNWAGCFQWVIVGVESNGPRVGRLSVDGTATEADWLAWARDIVRQCQATGVAVWVKQIPLNGKLVTNMAEFPADLQIQQFPAVNHES